MAITNKGLGVTCNMNQVGEERRRGKRTEQYFSRLAQSNEDSRALNASPGYRRVVWACSKPFPPLLPSLSRVYYCSE